MQKWILSLLMVALLATPALAFKDVPPNHWAYDAINKAVEAGILQGYNNMFHGKKTLNRFQMAVVVARMLDKVGKGGGGVDKDALKQLEALVTEFADELALLNVKVGKLEETVANMPKKAGGKAEVAAPAAAPGSVSIADGALKIGGIFKNWYLMSDNDVAGGVDNETFALRNARLLFWHKLTDDIKIFVQNDFASGMVVDFKATIKLPNSENTFNFGRYLTPITHYMHKNITQLDFIDYPIAVYKLGQMGGPTPNPYGTVGWPATDGAGVWRQDGMHFTFGEDTKFYLGVFNGNTANNGLAQNFTDDEDKAIMLKIEFKGTDKIKGAIWLYQDDVTPVPPATTAGELDAMGLWFSYKHKSFDFLAEYITQDWNPATGTNESDSIMAQFIVPMTKDKTDFMLRFEQYDYDNGLTGDAGDHDRMTIGFRWKMHERAHWQLEYWADEFNGGNTGVITGNEPSTIVTQLMVWF